MTVKFTGSAVPRLAAVTLISTVSPAVAFGGAEIAVTATSYSGGLISMVVLATLSVGLTSPARMALAPMA